MTCNHDIEDIATRTLDYCSQYFWILESRVCNKAANKIYKERSGCDLTQRWRSLHYRPSRGRGWSYGSLHAVNVDASFVKRFENKPQVFIQLCWSNRLKRKNWRKVNENHNDLSCIMIEPTSLSRLGCWQASIFLARSAKFWAKFWAWELLSATSALIFTWRWSDSVLTIPFGRTAKFQIYLSVGQPSGNLLHEEQINHMMLESA